MTGDELALRLEGETVVVLDVRSHDEYAGRAGYRCDPRQGHIPGAIHLEWTELYAAAGRPHDRDAILGLLAERGVDPTAEIVTYCHSGQRSLMAIVALRSAGIELLHNYEGSWHDWSRRE